MEPIICPNCGAQAVLANKSRVWPSIHAGLLYICSQYPKCDSYVSCHEGTDKPMGSLAGPRLRKLRSLCHTEFDPLWREANVLGRTAAYEAAAEVMQSDGEFHIGHLDEAGCERFLNLMDEVRRRYELRLEANQNKLAPPSELTLQILQSLLVTEDELIAQFPAEWLEKYPKAMSDSLRAGLIQPDDGQLTLTLRGRYLVFGKG